MTARPALTFAFAASLAFACGGGTPDPLTTEDAPGGGVDGDVVRLPAWMLEDVQPESPRAGQTYGLDTFSGKIVVVTLVEGF